jgi:hypothetical protein
MKIVRDTLPSARARDKHKSEVLLPLSDLPPIAGRSGSAASGFTE